MDRRGEQSGRAHRHPHERLAGAQLEPILCLLPAHPDHHPDPDRHPHHASAFDAGSGSARALTWHLLASSLGLGVLLQLLEPRAEVAHLLAARVGQVARLSSLAVFRRLGASRAPSADAQATRGHPRVRAALGCARLPATLGAQAAAQAATGDADARRAGRLGRRQAARYLGAQAAARGDGDADASARGDSARHGFLHSVHRPPRCRGTDGDADARRAGRLGAARLRATLGAQAAALSRLATPTSRRRLGAARLPPHSVHGPPGAPCAVRFAKAQPSARTRRTARVQADEPTVRAPAAALVTRDARSKNSSRHDRLAPRRSWQVFFVLVKPLVGLRACVSSRGEVGSAVRRVGARVLTMCALSQVPIRATVHPARFAGLSTTEWLRSVGAVAASSVATSGTCPLSRQCDGGPSASSTRSSRRFIMNCSMS